MADMSQYEEQILKELRALPAEALPKVLRLLNFMRAEFLTQDKQDKGEPREGMREQTSHERTRQLLSTSKGNWAQELVAEREDRL